MDESPGELIKPAAGREEGREGGMDEEDGSKGKSGQQTLDFVQAHMRRLSKAG